jgi:hypothetical protein
MNHKTCVPFAIAILAIVASPALAQSVVGGPTKPINHVGGAANHPNPMVPQAKGATAGAVSSKPAATKNTATTITNPRPTPTSAKKK